MSQYENWINWFLENLDRGCDEKELLSILKNTTRDLNSNKILEKAKNIYEDGVYHEFIKLNNIYLENSIRLDSSLINLNIVENFLPANECNQLIEIILKDNIDSPITIKNEKDPNFRTSKTCFMDEENPIVKKVNKKICQYMGFSDKRSESIQGQYYNIGKEFKEHTDYFNPENHEEWKKFGNELGQRTWTVMIYLNNVEEGGETIFTKIPIKIKPKKGRAVIWNNLDIRGKGNENTYHWGTKIKKGKKFIITKWFRTRGTLNYPYLSKEF